MRKVNTHSGQTMTDLVLQETGDLDRMVEVMVLNDRPMDSHFDPGGEAFLPDDPGNETSQYFRENGIILATGEHDHRNYPGGAYENDAYSNAYD